MRTFDPSFDTVGADALNFAGLGEAEQQRLHAERHLAELVEKQGAVVGHRREAWLVPVGAGKTAAHVTEKLRFEQRVGEAGAVDRDERAAATAAGLVDHPRDDFLTDAGLAHDQHFGVRTRGRPDILAKPFHFGAVAQQQGCRHSRFRLLASSEHELLCSHGALLLMGVWHFSLDELGSARRLNYNSGAY